MEDRLCRTCEQKKVGAFSKGQTRCRLCQGKVMKEWRDRFEQTVKNLASRECKECGIVKTTECFSRAAVYCKKCLSERTIKYKEKLGKREEFPVIEKLRCGFCCEVKQVSDFSQDFTSLSGYRNRCKKCENLKQCMRLKLREKRVEIVT
jgi:hypothetical protein